MSEKNVIIVDLDGTVRDGSHREHFIKGGEKDWNAYFMACGDDLPIMPVIKCIQALAYAGARGAFQGDTYEIVFMSGCGECARKQTLDWIEQYLLPPWRHGHLFMRPEGDFRPDFMLKKEWAQQIGVERILMAFEDRNGVVEMWRSLGIQCLQVAPGDF